MSTPSSPRQGNLFADGGSLAAASFLSPTPDLTLARAQLLAWQQAVGRFQAPLFASSREDAEQGDLFGGPGGSARAINPLELRAQTLHFWRWPQAPQQGAALYFVLDTPAGEQRPLLLYVGETGRADQRWKGEHDCKQYLAAYSEATGRVALSCQLSIRFWLDVPQPVRPRRQLEQALIRRWQPPFNKETRQRWATPFTADPG